MHGCMGLGEEDRASQSTMQTVLQLARQETNL